jgi:hypothetical protein
MELAAAAASTSTTGNALQELDLLQLVLLQLGCLLESSEKRLEAFLANGAGSGFDSGFGSVFPSSFGVAFGAVLASVSTLAFSADSDSVVGVAFDSACGNTVFDSVFTVVFAVVGADFGSAVGSAFGADFGAAAGADFDSDFDSASAFGFVVLVVNGIVDFLAFAVGDAADIWLVFDVLASSFSRNLFSRCLLRPSSRVKFSFKSFGVQMEQVFGSSHDTK